MPKESGNSSRGRPKIDAQKRGEIVQTFLKEGKTLSIRAIARKMGVSPPTVTSILKNAGHYPARKEKTKPNAETLDEVPPTMSLKVVAERAGVSKGTASLAMRDSPKIKPQTRAHVQAVARQIGYKVHPYVRAQLAAIRKGRIPQINAVLAYIYAWHGGRRPFKEAIKLHWGPVRTFKAASKAAEQRGYRLEPFDLSDDKRRGSRLEDILKNRGIRGLLLDTTSNFSAAHPMEFSRFNCVAFRDQDNLPLHLVGHDLLHNSLLIFAKLWELGYRRIGYAMNDTLSHSTLFQRDAGILHSQYHLVPEKMRIPLLHFNILARHMINYILKGLDPPERNRCEENDWLLAQDWSTLRNGKPSFDEVICEILRKWIEQYQPEVIICEDIKMMDWLNHLGYDIPGDIGIAHTKLNLDVSGWSGIRRADEMVGEAAVNRLCDSIDLGETGFPAFPIRQRIIGNWVEGNTTRKILNPAYPLKDSAQRWMRRVFLVPA